SISKSRSAGYWPAPNLSWPWHRPSERWAHEGAFKKAKTVVGWGEDIWSKTAPPAAPQRYPWGVCLSWTRGPAQSAAHGPQRPTHQTWEGAIHDKNTIAAPHAESHGDCRPGGRCRLVC